MIPGHRGNSFFSAARKIGIFPCDSNLKVTANLLTYSFFIVITFNFISLFGNFYFIRGTAKSAKSLVNWIAFLKSVFDNVFVFIHVIRLRIEVSRFRGVLRKFKSLPRQNMSTTSFKFTAVFFVGSIRHVILAIALLFTTDESNASSVLMEASSFYVHFCSFMVILLFCSLAEILSFHFDNLTKDSTYDIASVESKLDRHDRLRRLAEELNALFSWQLLVGCFNKSVDTVVYVFSAIDIVKGGTFEYEATRDLVIFSEHALWEVFNLFFLARCCSQIVDSFGLLGVKVLQLVREDKNLYESDKIQLYLLRHQDFEISACGYFSVGYHLLIVVATTSCTYLVVLVQSFS
ncbi:hypothetical protein GE061_010449 [Apolygus lucorum]|uniref:Gustatory receptor n=1 Tax=Apolygus lucorum TaxID=248454 RepID=A0A8S9XWR0_APOLU|nr:hypothetical protein GE061_010449 [Apolygus lucorum]